MILKTCLLISDDPDDHIEFSEALYEISNDTVLMTVSDVRKAVELLILKKCIPEYIFLNVSMPGFTPDDFFSPLNHNGILTNVAIIAYGENIHPTTLDPSYVAMFIDDGVSFSQLKKELRKVIS